MNIVNLFLESSILVKISIFMLILFSIISWSIIFHRIFIFNVARYKLKVFEVKFWSGIELSRLYQEISIPRKQFSATEHIFYVGFKEFSKLYQIKNCAPEMIITRTHRVMNNAMNIELEALENYIPLIGTIGSTSPYLGLFGTVLGIIHVFLKLGNMTTNVSSSHVIHMQIIAPGIAEALISTAIGLFVAIPAVMAFNYFNVQVNNLNQHYNNFIEEFIAILHRQVFFNTDTKLHKGNKNEETALRKILD